MLVREVLSLHPEKRNILISEDKGMLRILTCLAKFPPVYCNYLILLNLSDSSTAVHLAKPSIKYSGLFLWVFISLYLIFVFNIKLILNTFVSLSFILLVKQTTFKGGIIRLHFLVRKAANNLSSYLICHSCVLLEKEWLEGVGVGKMSEGGQ